MASTETSVTKAGGDVTHCLPTDMKWVKTLKVRKVYGNGMAGLRAKFMEKCPKCSKPRAEVNCKYAKGLTVEEDLLPNLRIKLSKCCAKEFQSAARRAAADGIFDPRAAKKRRRQDSTARLERRVTELQAELASTKKKLAAARKSVTLPTLSGGRSRLGASSSSMRRSCGRLGRRRCRSPSCLVRRARLSRSFSLLADRHAAQRAQHHARANCWRSSRSCGVFRIVAGSCPPCSRTRYLKRAGSGRPFCSRVRVCACSAHYNKGTPVFYNKKQRVLFLSRLRR